ncbi:recombinase family protein [Mangrovactinospora gilvigrisea]|uniref:recombinase family protein n=1 Tax=Mangrovactinospora gilvigrisea TaxID=1428644 RepID=UPI0008FCC488|nr:recombinase family protein [Mangrovactinospora gilvigrisea]
MPRSHANATDATRRAATGPLRAVDYLRVSTEEQVKGYGITYTSKRTKKHITSKGWQHVDTFADEGLSGSLEAHERPRLSDLMNHARQIPRPFDVVVVAEERAIGRAGRAFWPWVWELEDLGVFVAIVKGDYDNTTSDGRSRMRKAADRAEDERETIRDRTQGGIQEKAEDGGYIGGKVPYGYKVINKGIKGESRLAIDDCDSCPEACTTHEAAFLRRGRTLYVQHRDWEKVAEIANAEGLRKRNGDLWGYHSARQQILNKTVLQARQTFRGSRYVNRDPDGNCIYGDPVTIKLDSIFTKEEVQELLDAAKRPPRKPPTSRTYTLTGRIISPCGKRYVGAGRGRREKQYKCQGRNAPYAGAPTCECPELRAEPIEEAAWKKIRGLLENIDELKSMAEDWLGVRTGSTANFTKRINDLDKKIALQQKTIAITTSVTAKQLVTENADTDLDALETKLAETVAPLHTELAKLQKDKAEVESWLEESNGAGERLAHLVELAEMANRRLHNMPPRGQQELIDLIDADVTIIGKPPKGRIGQPCALAAWFNSQERDVPILTDGAWAKIAPLLTYQSRSVNPRTIMTGILYKVRTDTPWSRLPALFGHPATLQTYWTRWRESGFWAAAMDELGGQPGTPVPVQPLPQIEVKCLIEPQLLLESEKHRSDVAARG